MAEESQKGATKDGSSTTDFLSGNEVDFGRDLDISLSNDYNKQTSTTYEHEIDEGNSPLTHSSISFEKVPSYRERSDGVTSISFDASESRHPSHLTLLRKVGRLSAITLILSTAVILGILGFLSFLWHGSDGNSFWHWIMVSNYAPRTISISTFFLRYAVEFQAGIAAAMLAALALEFHGSRLHSAASLSIMRSGIANPFLLLKSTASGVRSRTSIAHLALPILLFLTTTALQLSSTVLLTDLRTGSLPSQRNTTSVAVDFFYNRTYSNRTGGLENITEYYGGYSAEVSTNYALVNRASAWLRNPGQYPAFAEYAEPAEKVEGVDDTGVLLRAFLPYTAASHRETLRNYSGNAVVLDTRVSCHRPSFSNASNILEQINKAAFPGLWGNVSGGVTTDRYTDRSLVPVDFSNFTCYLDGSYSLCQLAPELLSYTLNTPYKFGKTDNLLYPSGGNLAGALLSQFSNLTSTKFNPPTDEVINMMNTCRTAPDCANAQKQLNGRLIPTWGVSYLVSRTSITPNVTGRTFFEERNEWMDFYLKEEQYPPDQKIVSFSLCFAAWDVARLDVDMHADSPRSEPNIEWDSAAVAAASMSALDSARWNGSRSYLNVENFNDLDPATPSFDGILNQLGQISSNATSAADRGIMTLKNRTSWIPEDPDGRSPIDRKPYIQQDISYDGVDTAAQSGVGVSYAMKGNRSIFMTLRGINVTLPSRNSDASGIFGNIKDPYILADPSLGNMFLVSMQKTNSVARSLSSLITVLSGMAYYDQYPQFMTKTDAQQVVFVNVLYPQAVAGYVAVLLVALIHLLVVAAIVVLFVKRTRLTLLGNCWASISQLVAPETEDLLRGSAFTTDGEVKRELRRMGRDTEVKIRRQDGGDVDPG